MPVDRPRGASIITLMPVRALPLLAAAVVAGTAAGLWLPTAILPIILFATSVAVALAIARPSPALALIAVVLAAATWAGWQNGSLPYGPAPPTMPRLVKVTGKIVDRPRVHPADRGPLAGWGHGQIATRLTLELDTPTTAHRWPGDDRIWVQVSGAMNLQPGRRITVTGWLSPIRSPSHPDDRARTLAHRAGVFARLRVVDPAHVQVHPAGPLSRLMIQLRHRADIALVRYLETRPDTRQLLRG
ncbi:MAG: DUF4131 domain-containing protein, partial [Phycisphaeraceae bacterium]|nr:DUF4131 domain-containing protein [Phycisphaeraceae bacterium]